MIQNKVEIVLITTIVALIIFLCTCNLRMSDDRGACASARLSSESRDSENSQNVYAGYTTTVTDVTKDESDPFSILYDEEGFNEQFAHVPKTCVVHAAQKAFGALHDDRDEVSTNYSRDLGLKTLIPGRATESPEEMDAARAKRAAEFMCFNMPAVLSS